MRFRSRQGTDADSCRADPQLPVNSGTDASEEGQ